MILVLSYWLGIMEELFLVICWIMWNIVRVFWRKLGGFVFE